MDESIFNHNMFVDNSEEYVAKVITMCILQKAYETSSLWSKWILLASLDELLGKPAPLLDELQLQTLQGIEEKSKNIYSHDDFSDMNKTDSSRNISSFASSLCSKCKNVIQESNKNIQRNLFDKDSLKSRIPINTVTEDSTFVSSLTSIKCKIENNEDINRNSRTENAVSPNEPNVADIDNEHKIRHESDKKNKSTQCNIIGTELLLISNENTFEFISSSICQYTQTDSISTVDRSVERDFNYKLIKISDKNINRICQRRKSLHYRYRQLQKNAAIKLLHGRPLIGELSSKEPANIPLERLLPDLEIGDLYMDPRLEKRSIKKENDSFHDDDSTTAFTEELCYSFDNHDSSAG